MTLKIIRDVPPERGKTIQEQFETFHRLNPWVYEKLEELTYDYLQHGHRRIGIKMLWEVLRWQYNRSTRDPNTSFKAPNAYHSRYARLLIENHPEWANVFVIHPLRNK